MAAVRRQLSRTIRLIRFRVTAFPTFRVTVIPNLAPPATPDASESPLRRRKNRKCRPGMRRPRPWTARNSRRFRRRRREGKRRRAVNGHTRSALFFRDAHDQLLASLPAPAAEYLTARGGLHAFARAMRPFPAFAMGLKRPLHDEPPVLSTPTTRGVPASKTGAWISIRPGPCQFDRTRVFDSAGFRRGRARPWICADRRPSMTSNRHPANTGARREFCEVFTKVPPGPVGPRTFRARAIALGRISRGFAKSTMSGARDFLIAPDQRWNDQEK
jgi:hypothetical protein